MCVCFSKLGSPRKSAVIIGMAKEIVLSVLFKLIILQINNTFFLWSYLFIQTFIYTEGLCSNIICAFWIVFCVTVNWNIWMFQWELSSLNWLLFITFYSNILEQKVLTNLCQILQTYFFYINFYSKSFFLIKSFTLHKLMTWLQLLCRMNCFVQPHFQKPKNNDDKVGVGVSQQVTYLFFLCIQV